ncbi:two-component sensor histidine kinase [Rhodobacteraceae bacterium WD3A24]|nr:two-component sensor histidine kinase [Rhodobacteraceae bacterium WD3A24]
MTRLRPDSLRGQLVVVILAALIVAQGVSAWLFVDERSLAVRAALGMEAAGRAANIARLLEEAPETLHGSILRAADSPLVRFTLADRPAVDHAGHGDNGAVVARIRALLEARPERGIRVELHRIENALPPIPGLGPDMERMHRAMMRERMAAIEMQLSIELEGGQWLNIGTRFREPPLQWPWAGAASFGLSAALLLLTALWFLLTRLTGPLRHLANAADRLGRGEHVEELAVAGPRELRDLTHAFNRMQERLTRFVAERTRLLAALGHDLRSPLTAMRVRAELVEDDETRERLGAIIEEMQEMVEATLSFARGMATSEPSETVDLRELLRDLVDERMDPGGAVVLETGGLAAEGASARVRPNALRRALRNVIDNALRYGGRARVSLDASDDALTITVADDGPGIPQDSLERVFDPFLRLETSRSRETGGIGLGLSIARTIVQAHGGDIRLANRAEGGLAATITLPRAAAPADPTTHARRPA